MIVGSSFTHAVLSKARPCDDARLGRFDVEVVQHFEVIGDESACRHDDAGDILVGERVDHLEDVGADPGFGRASGGLPGDLPVVAFGEPDSCRDRFRCRTQLVWVRDRPHR